MNALKPILVVQFTYRLVLGETVVGVSPKNSPDAMDKNHVTRASYTDALGQSCNITAARRWPPCSMGLVRSLTDNPAFGSTFSSKEADQPAMVLRRSASWPVLPKIPQKA
jgi:hypothetical protein